MHHLAVHEALVILESDSAHGLASEEAERRLHRHGPNVLPRIERRGPLVRMALTGPAACAVRSGDTSVVVRQLPLVRSGVRDAVALRTALPRCKPFTHVRVIGTARRTATVRG